MGDHEEQKADMVKVVPTWMTESTVVIDDSISALISTDTNSFLTSSTAKDEVHELLKETEVKPGGQTSAPQPTQGGDDSSGDEFIDDDDEDENFMVQGVSYSYNQIQADPSLVQKMNTQETEEYTKYIHANMDIY
jgi:hypothetical protein